VAVIDFFSKHRKNPMAIPNDNGKPSLDIVQYDYRDQAHQNAVETLKGNRWTLYGFCIVDKHGSVKRKSQTAIFYGGIQAPTFLTNVVFPTRSGPVSRVLGCLRCRGDKYPAGFHDAA
jgi:hypothetical protein